MKKCWKCSKCALLNHHEDRHCGYCGCFNPVPLWVDSPVSSRKSHAPIIAFLSVAGVLGGIILMCTICSSSGGVNRTTPSPEALDSLPNSPLNEPEKKCLANAVQYFVTLDDVNKELSRAMAGTRTGDSTLGEVRSTIETMQMAEGAAYSRTRSDTPTICRSIDFNIVTVHDMYAAILTEYLEYWRDMNVVHIHSASAKYKKALVYSDTIVKQLNKMLDDEAKKRRQ